MKFATLMKSYSFAAAFVFCLVSASVRAQSSEPPQSQSAAPQTASSDADKSPAPRAHRLITNDDIPSRTVPNSTPEVEARLEQLNRCDHACFAQVFKDSQLAFRQRYNYPYPFSSKDDQLFEDAIVGRMDALRKKAEWQTMLRNALLSQEYYCKDSNAYQQKLARERAAGKPLTAQDVADEERGQKNAAPVPNYNTSTSAIIQYKFKIEKDFLLAAIVLYKYFEIVKTPCSSYPAAE